MTRGLPQIALTRAADVRRHVELLAVMRGGGGSAEDIAELSALDADIHRFDRMCRRWAPLSLTELGFMWGDTLVNETDPSITVTVRENALVSFEGADVTLAEVCSLLAARGTRVSLGGWVGNAGVVADLAGLRHGVGGAGAGATAQEPADGDDPVERMEAAPISGEKRRKTTKTTKESGPGSNYDLFG